MAVQRVCGFGKRKSGELSPAAIALRDFTRLSINFDVALASPNFHGLSIRGIAHLVNGITQRNLRQNLAAGEIPDDGRFILTAAGESFAVRAESQRCDLAPVPLETSQLLAGGGVE